MLSESERKTVLEAVLLAGRLCQKVRGQLDSSISRVKEDQSPVTVADFGSQAIILHTLAEAFPDIPAVGEEDASDLRSVEGAGIRERVVVEVQELLPTLSEAALLESIARGAHTGGRSGRFWALDPIDGTRGFLRNDQYAIALALIEEGEVTFGVLGCPYLPTDWRRPEAGRGCFFVAERGKGCMQLDASGLPLNRISVSSVRDPVEAVFCESVERGHSRHDWAAAVAERLGIRAEPIRMDSQCKYAAIARGEASIYLRLPTRPGYEEKIWDHAAGALCVTEAGGRVTDIAGALLDFSQGRTLKQNHGIIATNGCFHDDLVAAVQTAQ